MYPSISTKKKKKKKTSNYILQEFVLSSNTSIKKMIQIPKVSKNLEVILDSKNLFMHDLAL